MQPTTPLPPTNQPVLPNPMVPPASQSIPTETIDTGQVVATAKSLVAHYKQDPFRLSAELDQLKGAYLQSKYHIRVSDTEH